MDAPHFGPRGGADGARPGLADGARPGAEAPGFVRVAPGSDAGHLPAPVFGSGAPEPRPSGRQPARPSGRQPARPSGRHPAARPSGRHPAARSSGRHPAARPSGRRPAARPSGRLPAARPSGRYPTRSSGRHPAIPPSGHYPAGRPSGSHPPVPPARRPSDSYDLEETRAGDVFDLDTVRIRGGAAPSARAPSDDSTDEAGAVRVSASGRAVAGPSTPTPPSSPAARLGPGSTFAGYEILEQVGAGNMGRVLRCRDRLGRDVAIKIVLAHAADPEALARFLREGEALAAIPPHRNVVTVHTAGEAGGLPYLVLDYVAGDTLHDVLKRGPLRPATEAVRLAEKLARAIEHVHQAGVLHRDLKPANILIRGDDGEPVVTDFGMAGVAGAQSLTRTGDLLGTPLYMAPEQVLGLRDVDGRADVWALGVLLFELLVAKPPFAGRNLVEVGRAINNDPLPCDVAAVEGADGELRRIVERALCKHKTDRYANPGAMAVALRGWLDAHESPQTARRRGRGRWRRRLGRAGLALAVLGALAGGAAYAAPRVDLAGLLARFVAAERDAPTGPVAAPAVGAPAVPAAEPSPAELDRARLESLLAGLRAPDADYGALRAELADLTEGLRASPADQSRLLAGRAELVAAARERVPELEPAVLGDLLAVLRELAGPLPPDYARLPGQDGDREPTPAGALADAVLARIDARYRAAEASGDWVAATESLERLAASGLGLGRPEAGDALIDGASFTNMMPSLSVPPGAYWRTLVACARLDVPLAYDHVKDQYNDLGLADAPWDGEERSDPAVRYVLDRVAIANGSSQHARADLLELLAEPSPLGPRATARGLVAALDDHGPRAGPVEQLAIAERAVALDPASPWGQRRLAEALLAAGEPEAARAASERSLELFEAHAERPLANWEEEKFYAGAIEVCLGARDLERAEGLFAVFVDLGTVEPYESDPIRAMIDEARAAADEAAEAEAAPGE